MKKQAGITLIALVITIIVLLILAGVSISAITGDNGVVEKAREAATKTDVAEKEEQEMLGGLEEYINSSTSSENTTKTLVQAFKDGELNIGDYVTYTPSNTSATIELTRFDTGFSTWEQVYRVDKDVQWRVLGLNEDGTKLMITTAAPIKKDGRYSGLYFKNAEGYYNAVRVLDSISSIYHNENLAYETRSLTIDDINRLVGVVVKDNKVYRKNDANQTDIDLDFDKCLGESYIYKSGDYVLENYLKEKYPDNEEFQNLDTKEIGDEVIATSYGYYVLESNVLDSEEPLYDVLFENSDEAVNEYWLASTGISTDSYGCNFSIDCVAGDSVFSGGWDCFSSKGWWVLGRMGVKPVVLLKSDITLEDINIVNGNKELWINDVHDLLDSSGDLENGQLTD